MRFSPTVRGVNVRERLFPCAPPHSYDKPAGEAGKFRHGGFLFRECHFCAGVQLGEFRVGVSHQRCRYRRVYIFVAASSGTAIKHTRRDVGVAVPHRRSAFHIDTAEHFRVAESSERWVFQKIRHINYAFNPVRENQSQRVIAFRMSFFHGYVSALRCHDSKYRAFGCG